MLFGNGLHQMAEDKPFSIELDGNRRAGEPAVALALARYVVGLEAGTIEPHTRDTVLRCLLDALTSAASALDQGSVKAAQTASAALYGSGQVPLWFTGSSGASAAALLANGTATAALDLDDGYRRARGHPGAAVIPAAMCLAGIGPQTDMDEFIAAVVVGYEVGIRIAMSRPSYAPSGAWAPFAVVATAGRLLDASAEVIAQALSIAAQTAPALPALAGIVGSDVKEGIPAGSVAGWAALQLAMAGSSGPTTIFEDDALFCKKTILDGLGYEFLINGTYFKPFGCCRHIHGALDAFLQLKARHRWEAKDILGIEVHTYRATFNLSNKAAPKTLVEAQYSVPYCLALCALRGEDALVPLRAALLQDRQVTELAQQVAVLHDPAVEQFFPDRSPSWIVVTLKGVRRFQSPLTDPRGDPSHPLTWGELESKLRVATRHTLTATHQDAVIDGIAKLRLGDWAPLMAAIRTRGSV